MSHLSSWLFSAVLCLIASNAWAQRYYFGESRGVTSKLSTQVGSTNVGAAPVELKLSLPSLDVEPSTQGFQEIKAEGMSPLAEEGKPALLANGSLLAVPAGYEAKLTILSASHKEVANVNVIPFQRKCRCPEDKNAAKPLIVNQEIYQSTSLFPANVAELQDAGKLQNVRLVRVALHPVQMDMAKKLLRVTHDLSVRVEFVRKGNAVSLSLPKTLHRLLQQTTANAASLRSVNSAATGETMLIVVADDLKSSLTKLLAWERQKGITPYVVTLTEAGGSNESVKSYIQSFYDEAATKPTYLLMVGSKTNLPPFMKDVTFQGQNGASDYPFALLSGDDIVPDVLYGRLLADNAQDVETQVSRWIAYEKSPERGATWYKKGTTIASDEGSSPSDVDYAEQIQGSLKAHTFTEVDQLYQGKDTATFANFSAALNEGRSWITYIGHGDGTGWGSANDTINNASLAQLENMDRLPILIDVACLNGDYANIGMPFGRAFVTQTKNAKATGGVAYYGGSVSISWHPPAIMATGIAKQHFEKSLHHIGGSVLAGHLHVIEKLGVGDEATDNLIWYNLFGDPSLLVRTDTPKVLTVEHSNRNGEVEVRVTNDQGGGLSELRVALSDQNGPGVLAVGKTNAQGIARLSTTNVTQGILTVSGYNVETYEADLETR